MKLKKTSAIILLSSLMTTMVFSTSAEMIEESTDSLIEQEFIYETEEIDPEIVDAYEFEIEDENDDLYEAIEDSDLLDIEQDAYEDDFPETLDLEIDELETDNILCEDDILFFSDEENLLYADDTEEMKLSALDYETEMPGQNAPSDAEYWCGHYYKVISTKMSYSEADQYCKSMGGYLATFTSGAERNFILSLLDNLSNPDQYYHINGITTYEDTNNYLWDNDEYNYSHSGYDVNGGIYANQSGHINLVFGFLDTWTAPTYHLSFWRTVRLGDEGSAGDHGFICEWGDSLNINDTKADISPVSFIWDGNTKMPSKITLSYDDIELQENSDYSYLVSNNTRIGVADVTIIGRGRFTGTKMEHFIIAPQNVTGLAVECNNERTASLTWDEVPQASGYIVEYSRENAFPEDKTEQFIIEEETIDIEHLKRNTKYYFRVCAYTDCSNPFVEDGKIKGQLE